MTMPEAILANVIGNTILIVSLIWVGWLINLIGF